MMNNFALWFLSGFMSVLLWEVLPVDDGYSFAEKMKILILFSIIMTVLQTFFFPTLTP
ncbi:hypothetical protein HMPREF9016_00413 [Neisseria sp. oral taxon 014 str. F0314]|jgi:hypothetical protein|uniref:ABC transporter permease n=1 Tax=Neisseria oralis TaxID=1107316 RepID=A0ABW8Q1P0_9NEIS|nr:hypothetical protein [Neisseria sp. oral taxon 014]EFI24236.1 hypothetical protein HMPREF9016_00413 [Neisseria sp. oral taxon 014 str. F0314]